MVESPAISALESAAADLGKLLSGWTRDRLAEAEAAHADPADPEARSKRPDLATINSGIQSLWRLVSVQKSIQQLKNPPSAPAPDRPASEFRYGVQTSVCSGNPSPHPQAADVAPPPSAVIPNDKSSTDVAPAPSPAIHDSPFTLPSSVPSVPCVPSVPTLPSLQAIAAKTEKLYAETAALMAKTGRSMPEPDAIDRDQIGMNLLDIVSGRPKFPGSGNLLKSIRAELLTSPP